MNNSFTRIAAVGVLSIAVSACGKGPEQKSVSNLDVPVRSAAATAVTEAYGPLVVHEGEIDAEAYGQNPWSGSWLPLKTPDLFQSSNGDLAPLQKYDLYMQRVHGQKTHAADAERNDPYLYDPQAQGWEGRCDAWAAAAVSEVEPTKPYTVSGITFTVGDLKDLLTKTYENSHVLKQFGKNFGAGPDADFNQIYPDQFHRAIQHELVENHRLLVFDSDPTEQVWNTPLYRAMFEISGDSHDEHVMHVTTYIWGVIPLGVSPIVKDPNYVGAVTVNYTYTYDLFGYRQGDGSFRVAFGNWTGDSKDFHPNFVSVLTHDTAHSSNNTEISTDIVNEILAGARNQSP